MGLILRCLFVQEADEEQPAISWEAGWEMDIFAMRGAEGEDPLPGGQSVPL